MYLRGLFGSEAAEKVLLFIENYGDGYAKKIADTFKMSVSQAQKQLLKFEREGIIASRLQGRTRVYVWNPRFMFLKELRALLKKELTFLPEAMTEEYFRARMRPRRSGKP